jgi:hypothetical protein
VLRLELRSELPLTLLNELPDEVPDELREELRRELPHELLGGVSILDWRVAYDATLALTRGNGPTLHNYWTGYWNAAGT